MTSERLVIPRAKVLSSGWLREIGITEKQAIEVAMLLGAQCGLARREAKVLLRLR